MAVTGYASNFWEAHKSCINFPLCSREDRKLFSAEFRVWWDTRDPSFVFDLSSPISFEMPLPADVLRDCTLEFEIKVKRDLADLREYLREVVRDKDCCRELADTIIKDIEAMNSTQENELATFRAELD